MFRFTIRDVLWLTVVVGLSIAWYFDHREMRESFQYWGRLQSQRDRFFLENEELRERLKFEQEKYQAMIRPDVADPFDSQKASPDEN